MNDKTATGLQAWLDGISIKTDPALLTQRERAAVEELMGHEGMAVLLGLMMGARQGFYVRLANSPLGAMPEVTAAAVIQGTVRGIDMLWQTLLELSVPAQAGDGAASE